MKRDQFVTIRPKGTNPPLRVSQDDNTVVLAQEVLKVRHEMTSLREQMSDELMSQDIKLTRAIRVIETYDMKLSDAVTTIASYEVRLDKYAGLVDTLVGVITRYEDISKSTL